MFTQSFNFLEVTDSQIEKLDNTKRLVIYSFAQPARLDLMKEKDGSWTLSHEDVFLFKLWDCRITEITVADTRALRVEVRLGKYQRYAIIGFIMLIIFSCIPRMLEDSTAIFMSIFMVGIASGFFLCVSWIQGAYLKTKIRKWFFDLLVGE